MSYLIKKIFYTLQGEGANSGRPAVFCRFSGCNLWSGLEEDRPTAVCRFCDTDFIGTDGRNGGRYDKADELADCIASLWPEESSPGVTPFVVCTGGEPLLQLDESLVAALHRLGFEIAVETNGTLVPPEGIDWICVSPKVGAKLALRAGDELKLAFPQPGADPALYEELDFRYHYLQPIDSACTDDNLRLALRYSLEHPRWRLSLQTHKLLGIP